jgi:hypothetical protein
VALYKASQSAVRFRQRLYDVHHNQNGPTTVHEDNEGAFKLVNIVIASHKIVLALAPRYLVTTGYGPATKLHKR